MQELRVDVSINDLRKPSEERMRAIYTDILRTLMAAGNNAMDSKLFMKNMDFPELYDQAFANLFLQKKLIKCMQRFGVKDFNLSDIILTNSDRVIRNLSAVINFAKFRMEKLKNYTAMKDKETQNEKNVRKINERKFRIR